MTMRLDKFLASFTGAARSEIKKILKQQRIQVNGAIEKKGERKIDPQQDLIAMDGKTVLYQPFVCLMLNKPAGYVTATKDAHQKTVMDLINHPRKAELFPVGRLDIDTEGLLLLMNDGDLAHHMLSPKHHVSKTYFVRVAGAVTEEDAAAFSNGVDIGEKHLTMPAQSRILRVYSPPESPEQTVSEVHLTIQEGKYHQVKRMFEARGKKVIYLRRIAMAGIFLDPALKTGSFRELTREETELLNR